MKNICPSCEKQFKNNERHYAACGNYCSKCHERASTSGKNFVYDYRQAQENRKWWRDLKNNNGVGAKASV